MKRFVKWMLIIFAILSVFHALLTGSLIPRWIIEHLTAPQSIISIGDNSVTTAQGYVISLPNAKLLRDKAAISQDLFKHGIELSSAGEAYGLLRIHHWCGNDPVRYHLARVNLNSLATLLLVQPQTRVTLHGLDPGVFNLLRLPASEIAELGK